MAGDGADAYGEAASSSVPLQPCCCSWTAAAADDVGVWEGQMLAAEKPSDWMAVDGGCDDGDGDDWVYIGRDENRNLVAGDLVVIGKMDPKLVEHKPAGLDEDGYLIMDEELMGHLEWVKTLDIYLT